MSKLSETLLKEIDDNKLLVEDISYLDNYDKREISKILSSPTNKKWILKSFNKEYIDDEREIQFTVKNGKRILSVEFNLDFYELTNYIVDLCDDLGLPIKTGFEKNTNIQWIEIHLT